MTQDPFDLHDFLPYLLNRAAEESSLSFNRIYKDRYGMLRTEWRVLFHLGTYGEMSARDISDKARIHKTKVSRAIAALEAKRFVSREKSEEDRRFEILRLLPQGQAAFRDLSQAAESYQDRLRQKFSKKEMDVLRSCLHKLIDA